MSNKANYYLNNLQQDTSLNPSPALWAFNGAPGAGIADYIERPDLGRFLFEDFSVFPTGGPYPLAAPFQGMKGVWSGYEGIGTSVADAKMEGAAAVFSNNQAGQGALYCQQATTLKFIDSTGLLREYMVFECGVSLSAFGGQDNFVGLTDITVPTLNALFTGTPGQLNNTVNLVGFQRSAVGAGNDWGFVYQKAGSPAVYPTGLQTLYTTLSSMAPVVLSSVAPPLAQNPVGVPLVANQFLKLGFIFDANPGNNYMLVYNPTTNQIANTFRKPLLRIGVNNIVNPSPFPWLSSDNINMAGFPSVPLTRTFGFYNQSAAAGTMAMTFIGTAQGSNY